MDSLASRFYSTEDLKNRTELVEEAKKFVDTMRSSVNATEEKNKAADYYTRVSISYTFLDFSPKSHLKSGLLSLSSRPVLVLFI